MIITVASDINNKKNHIIQLRKMIKVNISYHCLKLTIVADVYIKDLSLEEFNNFEEQVTEI
jgi:hypothetical protein